MDTTQLDDKLSKALDLVEAISTRLGTAEKALEDLAQLVVRVERLRLEVPEPPPDPQPQRCPLCDHLEGQVTATANESTEVCSHCLAVWRTE